MYTKRLHSFAYMNKAAEDLLKRAQKFKKAVEEKRYSAVECLLADPKVPVSLSAMAIEKMFTLGDRKMAQAFLKRPRIDWLAPACNRNLYKLEKEFGVKFAAPFENKKYNMRARKVCKSHLDYFYYLSEQMVRNCYMETQQIYEKMISELVELERQESGQDCNLDALLFNTASSIIAFEAALNYCTNLQAKMNLVKICFIRLIICMWLICWLGQESM